MDTAKNRTCYILSSAGFYYDLSERRFIPEKKLINKLELSTHEYLENFMNGKEEFEGCIIEIDGVELNENLD